MEEEIWKDIKDYEGLYQVSNLGRVRSCDRYVIYNDGRKKFYKGKIMSQDKNTSGYIMVGLSKNGRRKQYLVHRLVCEAFIKNDENLPQVNHKDENRENNNVNNLEWCDSQYNVDYSQSHSIYQLDKDDNIICEYKSISEAAKKIGINISTIYNALQGNQKTSGGYKWKYKNINSVANRTFINCPIYQLDEDDNIICEYKSIREAAKKTGINRENVTNVLKGCQKTAGGYKWRYKENNTNLHPIYQLDKDDNIICEYKSSYEASRKNSIGYSSIRRVLQGKRKTAGGYKWRYKE